MGACGGAGIAGVEVSAATELREALKPGTVVDVTNHYISREDHPCYGTKRRTLQSVNSSSIRFDVGGRIPWPKASAVQQMEDGSFKIYGHPKKDDLFLTLRFA